MRVLLRKKKQSAARWLRATRVAACLAGRQVVLRQCQTRYGVIQRFIDCFT
jgi:uncharacterized lipoprotein YmbA